MIVSALTSSENKELGLTEESRYCKNCDVEFVSFPIEDRSVPNSISKFNELVSSLTEYLRSGKAVGVHCRAGIGRSSMIVAGVLIHNGFSAASAFNAIEEARGCEVPDTPEQREWVEQNTSRFNPKPVD